MDIWTEVFVSDVRGFDSPGRWLLQPNTGRVGFTSVLWRTVSELAGWAAEVASDPDDPASRARMAEYLASTEWFLTILRMGVEETTKEAK